MRCDAMRSQCPTRGGGDRNIRIIDADSSFGGARRGAGLRLRGARATPGPPSSPAPDYRNKSAPEKLLHKIHTWPNVCVRACACVYGLGIVIY